MSGISSQEWVVGAPRVSELKPPVATADADDGVAAVGVCCLWARAHRAACCLDAEGRH